MTDWADEQAEDLMTVSPKHRAGMIAFALRQAVRRGHSDAAAWHRKQAGQMRAIIDDGERGLITREADIERARLYAPHHDACAVMIERMQ